MERSNEEMLNDCLKYQPSKVQFGITPESCPFYCIEDSANCSEDISGLTPQLYPWNTYVNCDSNIWKDNQLPQQWYVGDDQFNYLTKFSTEHQSKGPMTTAVQTNSKTNSFAELARLITSRSCFKNAYVSNEDAFPLINTNQSVSKDIYGLQSQAGCNNEAIKSLFPIQQSAFPVALDGFDADKFHYLNKRVHSASMLLQNTIPFEDEKPKFVLSKKRSASDTCLIISVPVSKLKEEFHYTTINDNIADKYNDYLTLFKNLKQPMEEHSELMCKSVCAAGINEPSHNSLTNDDFPLVSQNTHFHNSSENNEIPQLTDGSITGLQLFSDDMGIEGITSFNSSILEPSNTSSLDDHPFRNNLQEAVTFQQTTEQQTHTKPNELNIADVQSQSVAFVDGWHVKDEGNEDYESPEITITHTVSGGDPGVDPHVEQSSVNSLHFYPLNNSSIPPLIEFSSDAPVHFEYNLNQRLYQAGDHVEDNITPVDQQSTRHFQKTIPKRGKRHFPFAQPHTVASNRRNKFNRSWFSSDTEVINDSLAVSSKVTNRPQISEVYSASCSTISTRSGRKSARIWSYLLPILLGWFLFWLLYFWIIPQCGTMFEWHCKENTLFWRLIIRPFNLDRIKGSPPPV